MLHYASIMLALCFMLLLTYYAKKYAGIIGASLFSIASMMKCKGDTPLNILVIIKLIALKVDPKPLGIHNMVDANPPVLL